MAGVAPYHPTTYRPTLPFQFRSRKKERKEKKKVIQHILPLPLLCPISRLIMARTYNGFLIVAVSNYNVYTNRTKELVSATQGVRQVEHLTSTSTVLCQRMLQLVLSVSCCLRQRVQLCGSASAEEYLPHSLCCTYIRKGTCTYCIHSCSVLYYCVLLLYGVGFKNKEYGTSPPAARLAAPCPAPLTLTQLRALFLSAKLLNHTTYLLT